MRAAGGGTFADALVDEGFASSLGVARSLAEQYHLPLVDLAVAGVDAEAAKLIAAAGARARVRDPVCERRRDVKVAITIPQDVRGLDELRLATRQSSSSPSPRGATCSPSSAGSGAPPRR